MASATNKISCGCTAALMASSSSINGSSTCRRPAVSSSNTVACSALACSSAATAMSTGFIRVVEGKTGMSSCPASTVSCSIAARTVDVSRNQIRAHFLLAQQVGDFSGRGGFARALKAHKHDHRGFAALKIEPCGLAPEQGNQFVIDDFNNLLGRVHALERLLTQTLHAHAFHKVLDDFEIDVSFQKRQPHLAQARLHVFLGEPAVPAERAEHAGKSVGKALEHGDLKALAVPRRKSRKITKRAQTGGACVKNARCL